MNKTDIIVYGIVFLSIGFVIGYLFGFSSAITKCTQVAFDFLDKSGFKIDKSLIIEYLQRAGL